MKLRPTRNRVVIKYLEVENKTKGGILLPSDTKKEPTTGIVIAAGEDDLGDIVNKDDIVLFGKYAGTKVVIQEEEFVIMKYSEIMGIISNT